MSNPPPPMRSCECGHGKDQHYTFADGAVLACSLSDCVCREFRPIPPSGHVARAATVAGSGGEGNVKKIHNGSTKPPASGAEKCECEHNKARHFSIQGCNEFACNCYGFNTSPSQGAEGCEHDFVTFRDDPHKTCRKCFQAEGVGEWEKEVGMIRGHACPIHGLSALVSDDSTDYGEDYWCNSCKGRQWSKGRPSPIEASKWIATIIRSTLAAERSRVEKVGNDYVKVDGVEYLSFPELGRRIDASIGEVLRDVIRAAERLLPTPSSKDNP